jgi:hypothetical protein
MVTKTTAGMYTLAVLANVTSLTFVMDAAGGGGVLVASGGAGGTVSGTITIPSSSIPTTFNAIVRDTGGSGNAGTEGAGGAGGGSAYTGGTATISVSVSGASNGGGSAGGAASTAGTPGSVSFMGAGLPWCNEPRGFNESIEGRSARLQWSGRLACAKERVPSM